VEVRGPVDLAQTPDLKRITYSYVEELVTKTFHSFGGKVTLDTDRLIYTTQTNKIVPMKYTGMFTYTFDLNLSKSGNRITITFPYWVVKYAFSENLLKMETYLPMLEIDNNKKLGKPYSQAGKTQRNPVVDYGRALGPLTRNIDVDIVQEFENRVSEVSCDSEEEEPYISIAHTYKAKS
jgi:hypothetical protein